MKRMKNQLKSLRVNISVNRNFLREIDDWCVMTHRNRSDFIREACRYYIKKYLQQDRIG